LPQWNVILKSIQAPINMFDTHRQTRSRLKGVMAGGGLGIVHHAIRGGQEIFANSTGFMHKKASQITSTALGNFSDFSGQGVSYTFVIDDFKHAVLQKFKMNLTEKGYMWDTGALKKNLTEVIYGYMATDDYLKVVNQAGYDNDSAAVRHFAQTTLRGNNNAKDIEIMKTVSLGSSALRTNVGRLQASIDLIHADKSLARHIRNRLLPAVKEELAKDSKRFSTQLLGEPEDITGNLLRKTRVARIWAAPYLSVADYSYEAFGSGFEFKNMKESIR